MPPAGPTRPADDLWLAAHDSVTGKPQVGGWALGVGLACGLLAELIHGGFLRLLQGQLFRTSAVSADDPALRPVLAKMADEEQASPASAAPARAAAWAPAGRASHDWPAQNLYRQRSALADPAGWEDPSPTSEALGRHRGTAEGDFRRGSYGHELGTWLSYLAYDARAETQVIERLARRGLARRVEQRRFLRPASVVFVPCDSVAAATPANRISVAVQNRRRLDWSQLCLAGLIVATGLHHHALATLTSDDRSRLNDELRRGLDDQTRELIRAADITVAEAALR